MQRTLAGTLVVDFTRYIPGAFAGAELLRHGARVVRVERRSGGDPMRATAPAWHDALNAGKESVEWDRFLPKALLARADVVLESFRPGVAAELGIGPDDAPDTAVYCSITGFGVGGPHEQRAGHDLNYVGWAGVLGAPALPPVQAADFAAGGLYAVTEILAGLLERERTGRGAHIVVSMTHNAHRLASRAPVLTTGVSCYRMYETADGRHLTVAALERKFFVRLCELVGRPELAARQFEPDDGSLARVFAQRGLADWLALFDGEDVCVGPVATYAEAAAQFGDADAPAPRLGEHTGAWRAALGL